MNRIQALREHLRALPVECVADVLSTLADGLRGLEPRYLAHRLSDLMHRPGALDTLTLPQRDLLKAAAEIAAPEPGEHGYDPALSVALRAMGHGESMTVDWLRVLELMDLPSGQSRRAAEAAIAGLTARALTWPTGGGDHHLVTGLVERFGNDRQRPPRVSDALDACYNLPEVRRVALALGVDPTRGRHLVQRDVVSVLTDPGRLRALFEAAPAGAKDLMKALAAHGGPMGTYCFVGGPPFEPKFRFRREGSGDPDTDWLAERGLIVPCPHEQEQAMLPLEVDDYLKERTPRPFAQSPPGFAAVPIDESLVHNEGRDALLGLLGSVDRLVGEVARAPLSLRKSGGITVRDQTRVAEVLGQPREHTALWIELAHRAGALARTEGNLTVDEPDSAWFRAGPAERLTALLRAWTDLPAVVTLGPDGRGAVPLQEEEPGVAPFRTGMLLALADLPEGYGTGINGEAVLEELARREFPEAEGLWWLFEAASWHRDAAMVGAERVRPFAHVVREAERVGVLAYGALTPVGRALSGSDAALTEALYELLPPVQETVRFQGDLTATVMGDPGDLAGTAPVHRRRPGRRWIRKRVAPVRHFGGQGPERGVHRRPPPRRAVRGGCGRFPAPDPGIPGQGHRSRARADPGGGLCQLCAVRGRGPGSRDGGRSSPARPTGALDRRHRPGQCETSGRDDRSAPEGGLHAGQGGRERRPSHRTRPLHGRGH
nr:hypothetical protein [Nocardiopsis coralli]